MLAEAEPLVADADAAASAVDSQAKLDAPGTEAVPPFAAAARAVLAPNGDDALAERTTIPCDLCGEAVPLSSFLHHVQVSHGINLNAVVDVTPDKPGFGGAWPRIEVALDHDATSQTPSPIVHVDDGRSTDGTGGEANGSFGRRLPGELKNAVVALSPASARRRLKTLALRDQMGTRHRTRGGIGKDPKDATGPEGA